MMNEEILPILCHQEAILVLRRVKLEVANLSLLQFPRLHFLLGCLKWALVLGNSLRRVPGGLLYSRGREILGVGRWDYVHRLDVDHLRLRLTPLLLAVLEVCFR